MHYQYNPEIIRIPERYQPAARPWWLEPLVAVLLAVIVRFLCC